MIIGSKVPNRPLAGHYPGAWVAAPTCTQRVFPCNSEYPFSTRWLHNLWHDQNLPLSFLTLSLSRWNWHWSPDIYVVAAMMFRNVCSLRHFRLSRTVAEINTRSTHIKSKRRSSSLGGVQRTGTIAKYSYNAIESFVKCVSCLVYPRMVKWITPCCCYPNIAKQTDRPSNCRSKVLSFLRGNKIKRFTPCLTP